MKTFSEFGITTKTKGLIGDKIKTERILNRQIVVEAYRIGPSKFEDKGDRLDLQFTLNGNRHIIFTSGIILMDALRKIPECDFPFLATIIKENDYLKFT